jgi:hypothetical protein
MRPTPETFYDFDRACLEYEKEFDEARRSNKEAPTPSVLTSKWGRTAQRDELKPCPFCGTKAISQGRLANNWTEEQWRIQCGNPFCLVMCVTQTFALFDDAVRAWESRRTAEETE